MSKRLLLAICCSSCLATAAEPQIVPLWTSDTLGSEGKRSEESVRVTDKGEHVVSNVHKPSITVYLPEKNKATGAGVLIAPGGGHRELWVDHEGHNIAKWLRDRGVAAFVLKYRLAREKDSTYTIAGTSLADTQRALRLVRARAAGFLVDPDRLGVMGFSAGGELAALAALHADDTATTKSDPVDDHSARPAFQALIYPAIPRDMQLGKQMPPAFLACGENDRQNISQGLPELYLAMKRAGMSAELHVYARTGHGFGLRPATAAPVAGWIDRFFEWLGVLGLLKH